MRHYTPDDFLPANWRTANRSTVSAMKRLERAIRKARLANKEQEAEAKANDEAE